MIQQGIKCMPAQSGGRYWQDPYGPHLQRDRGEALRAKQVEYGQQERIEAARSAVSCSCSATRLRSRMATDGMTREQRGKLQIGAWGGIASGRKNSIRRSTLSSTILCSTGSAW